MTSLNRKTAVITGATSGIGWEVAHQLAEEGVALVCTYREPQRFNVLKQSIEKNVQSASIIGFHVQLDQDIDASDLQDMSKTDPDLLIHCAGAIVVKPLMETDKKDLIDLYRVNVVNPFLITQFFLPSLVRKRGQIVLVNSSASQQKAKADVFAYTASKYALTAMADSLRDEVNQHEVRVISIFPGKTATAMQEAMHRTTGRPYNGSNMLQAADVAETIVSALKLPRTAETTDIMIRPLRKC